MAAFPALSVILDMDGLMFDTEVVSRRVWTEAARELDVNLRPGVLAEMVGLNEASSRALLERVLGPAPIDALIALARQRYFDDLERHGVPKKPGLDRLLDFLGQRRIPRAVATSTARALAIHKLRKADVLDDFDVVVGGDEVPHGKPAPDIFVLAARRLGHDPTACVVLEDSAPGIRAANAAGMTTILVPDGGAAPDALRSLARETAETLAEAQGILERLIDAAPSRLTESGRENGPRGASRAQRES